MRPRRRTILRNGCRMWPERGNGLTAPSRRGERLPGRQRLEELGEVLLDLGGKLDRLAPVLERFDERPAPGAVLLVHLDEEIERRREPVLPDGGNECEDVVPPLLRGPLEILLDIRVMLARLLQDEALQPLPDLGRDLRRLDLPGQRAGLVVGLQEMDARIAFGDVDVQLLLQVRLNGSIDVIAQKVSQFLAVHRFSAVPSFTYRASRSL